MFYIFTFILVMLMIVEEIDFWILINSFRHFLYPREVLKNASSLHIDIYVKHLAKNYLCCRLRGYSNIEQRALQILYAMIPVFLSLHFNTYALEYWSGYWNVWFFVIKIYFTILNFCCYLHKFYLTVYWVKRYVFLANNLIYKFHAHLQFLIKSTNDW